MFSSLAALGIQEPENIERYTLRKVAHEDLLKIYFRKQKGELFTKCLRFKYPRQHKQISVDSGRVITEKFQKSITTSHWLLKSW